MGSPRSSNEANQELIIFNGLQACVRTDKGDSDWFNIGQGVIQRPSMHIISYLITQ